MSVTRIAILSGSFFCFLAVALGAFAAHGLKAELSDYALGIFKTGAEYQFMHGLGLVLVGILSAQGYKLRATMWSFIGGIILFSGSLYGLALTGLAVFGPITPLGGSLFLLGWLLLAVQVYRQQD
ncbi:DUF423 domain-containing protein [Pseudoalteromonas fenneropenaei]|uniref:DUF423 domain-containing protein n=1 Tax=Pseudoalteromonas fenneropenaei TaxID=1737459 RepID=A0ABV7CGN5_9GAMM